MKDWTKYQDFDFECFRGELKNHIMYALDMNANLIWKVDLRSRTAMVETWINDEESRTTDYFSICLNDDELILMPKTCGSFAIYDLKNKKFLTASSETMTANIKKHSGLPPFFEAVAYGGDAYLLGAGSKSIVKINSKNVSATISEVWSGKDYNGSFNDNSSLFFSHGKLVENPYIYVTGGKYHAVFRIDTQTTKCRYFTLGKSIKRVYGIIKYQDAKWLLANTDGALCFIKWDENEKGNDRIIIGNENLDAQWWNPIFLDGYYYIFPTNGSRVYRVDIVRKEACLVKGISPVLEDMHAQNGKYLLRLMGHYDSKILFLTNWNHKWHEFNTVTGTLESFYIKITDPNYQHWYWNTWKDGIKENGGIVREEDMQLVRFIEMIADDNA